MSRGLCWVLNDVSFRHVRRSLNELAKAEPGIAFQLKHLDTIVGSAQPMAAPPRIIFDEPSQSMKVRAL